MGSHADEPVKGFGRRCAMGCESWPDDNAYDICPICGEVTTRYNNVYPIDAEEAKSKAAHARFDDFYENRCAELGVTVSGPIRGLPGVAGGTQAAAQLRAKTGVS